MALSRILYTPSHRRCPQLDNFISFEALPPSLTVPQLAEVLDISRNAAYKLVHDPAFYPAFVVGRAIRISRDGLEKWINHQHQKEGGQ